MRTRRMSARPARPKSLSRAGEDGVAVAERALRRVEREDAAREQVDRVERLEAVLQFHAVRADVLHRGCAHGPRDQCQILEARQALVERPGDEVVPVLACARLDDGCVRLVLQDAPPRHLDLEHGRLHVPGQDDVASAPKDELGRIGQLRMGQHALHVAFAPDPHERAGARHDAERVVRLQRGVGLDDHGTIVAQKTAPGSRRTACLRSIPSANPTWWK
jgi:hypothetical protein